MEPTGGSSGREPPAPPPERWELGVAVSLLSVLGAEAAMSS